MKIVRVYKISIRENILRQVIFTDRNIFYTCCVVLTYVFWQLVGEAPTDIKIFVSVVLCGALLLLAGIKLDRQPLVFLIPRIISFIISIRTKRF